MIGAVSRSVSRTAAGLALAAVLAIAPAGCIVYDVAETAVDVTTTAVGTAVDVTAGAVRLAIPDGDDDEDDGER